MIINDYYRVHCFFYNFCHRLFYKIVCSLSLCVLLQYLSDFIFFYVYSVFDNCFTNVFFSCIVSSNATFHFASYDRETRAEKRVTLVLITMKIVQYKNDIFLKCASYSYMSPRWNGAIKLAEKPLFKRFRGLSNRPYVSYICM